MKNKKIIIILTSVIVLIGGVFLIYNIYQNKGKLNKTKRKRQSNLAIMIKEDGATEYTKSSSKDIPKGDYTLNREKSYCKNNGVIGDYDSDLGKVSFSFIGTDSCYLYFDYKEDTSLYGTIKKRAQTDTTYLALYTGEGADTYANKVYYYKDDVQNNNVLFGGFCWKIVRTTETGGVKLLYNGNQNDYYESKPIDENEYMNLNNDSNYPFTFESTNKTWKSTNIDENISSTITFSAPSNGNYVLNYDLSMSDDNNIFIEVFKNDESQEKISEKMIGQVILNGLTTSDLIKVVYTRNEVYVSTLKKDNVTFYFGKTGNLIKTCYNTGTNSQIGVSAFNSNYNTPAYVGYMFNEDSVYKPYTTNVIDAMYFSGTKAYADSVTYDSSTKKYTLDSATATTLSVSTSNGGTLVGKYTCNQSTTTATCTNAYYIANYSRNYIFYYSLSSGDIDGTDNGKKYVFGKSFTYSDGTYTLSETKMIDSADWVNNYTDINNYHYTCLNETTKCDSIFYVYYISHYSDRDPFFIKLTDGKSVSDALNDMLYADDVNKNDSTIKTYIDSWYENNLANYENRLEDTVFCNDRTISNLGGWNSNGGNARMRLSFHANKNLTCEKETDRFSVNNLKAKLKYPIGLLSETEINLATGQSYEESYYYNNNYFWLNTPGLFDDYHSSVYSFSRDSAGWTIEDINGVVNKFGVRPSVSLKPKTYFSSGDGSFTNPFVIE